MELILEFWKLLMLEILEIIEYKNNIGRILR